MGLSFRAFRLAGVGVRSIAFLAFFLGLSFTSSSESLDAKPSDSPKSRTGLRHKAAPPFITKDLKGEFPQIGLTKRFIEKPFDKFISPVSKDKDSRQIAEREAFEKEYDVAKQTALLYAPENYTPNGTWGVLIYISLVDKEGVSSASKKNAQRRIPQDWKKMLSAQKLIFVGPDIAGNNSSFAKRSIALDSLASVLDNYSIAKGRVYVGGASASGTMAGTLAALYPGVFRGAIIEVMPFAIGNVGASSVPNANGGQSPCAFNFLVANDEELAAFRKYGVRWAFITGDKDFNYQLILSAAEIWRQEDLPFRVFDVPGMGHTIADANVCEAALRWLQGERVAGYEPRSLPRQ